MYAPETFRCRPESCCTRSTITSFACPSATNRNLPDRPVTPLSVSSPLVSQPAAQSIRLGHEEPAAVKRSFEMKFRILCISLGTSFLCACVGALWSQALKLPIECERINAVSSQIAQGQIDDAMHTVSQILAGDSSGREPACLAL